MDFTLNEDHLALRDAVRRFCDGEYPAQQRGDRPTAERAAARHAGMAALGLFDVSEDAGQGPVEAMLVAEELGRALADGWLSQVPLAGQLLAEAGSGEQRARWLPAVAAGSCCVALAVEEADTRYAVDAPSCAARADAAGWRLTGRKSGVAGGDAADLVLVLARAPAGPTLFTVSGAAPGLVRQAYRTLDQRGAAHLVLDGVAAEPVGPVGGALPFVEAALDRGNAALCAEAAGAFAVLLEHTAEHLRTRRQFGAPLAKFQALQHGIADLAIALEQIRSMACVAALALTAGAAERAWRVSAAKALVARLARRGALAAIQMHGAMGMTDECRVSHYARRLIAIGQQLGDASFHRQRFAAHRPHHDDGDTP